MGYILAMRNRKFVFLFSGIISGIYNSNPDEKVGWCSLSTFWKFKVKLEFSFLP